jgi:hypothetical protein
MQGEVSATAGDAPAAAEGQVDGLAPPAQPPSPEPVVASSGATPEVATRAQAGRSAYPPPAAASGVGFAIATNHAR